MNFALRLWASTLLGQTLDRDSLLTEAPAIALPGTVRVNRGGNTSWAGALSRCVL